MSAMRTKLRLARDSEAFPVLGAGPRRASFISAPAFECDDADLRVVTHRPCGCSGASTGPMRLWVDNTLVRVMRVAPAPL